MMLARKTLNIFVIMAAFFVVLGFLGAWSRPADSFSLLRPVFAAFALIGLFSLPTWRAKIITAGIGALGLASVIMYALPQPAGGDIRIYSKNMWFANTQITAVAQDIVGADVDAVFLQEMSDSNLDLLDLIAPSFPHQHLCMFSKWSGIAIASRFPFAAEPECTRLRALAAAQVVINETPVWLVSAHIPWPWPKNSLAYENDATALLSKLDGPIVIAGDFNIFAWSNRVKAMADLTKTKLAGPAQTTLTYRGVPLAIDHALAPGGGSLEIRPRLGSDHHGIVVDLALLP